MIDVSAEVERLSKRLSKMQEEFDRLAARLSSPKVRTELMFVNSFSFILIHAYEQSILAGLMMQLYNMVLGYETYKSEMFADILTHNSVKIFLAIQIVSYTLASWLFRSIFAMSFVIIKRHQ